MRPGWAAVISQNAQIGVNPGHIRPSKNRCAAGGVFHQIFAQAVKRARAIFFFCARPRRKIIIRAQNRVFDINRRHNAALIKPAAVAKSIHIRIGHVVGDGVAI